MDSILIITFAVALVLGAVVLAVMTMKGGGRTYLDVDKYRVRWLTIEQQVKRDNEASCHLAILNADKLLDRALKERGFAGNTMGERMKSASKQWSSANNVWTAHKLRNQVAHESDVKLNYAQTSQALNAFKQALKDLGAI